MLLQLVNDKGTHGAVLVAILDALCDWVDDAALGPYDPLRSYTISAATTQVTETASKISTTTTTAAAATTTPPVSTSISGSKPKKRRIGSLSDKETVLFLSKMAQLTRMGLEATQTKDWENKLLGAIYKLCAPGGKHDEILRREVFAKVERQHLLGLRTRNPLFKDKFFQLYDVAIGQSLFLRLQYIVTVQEWDAMADTFWLMQGLDLILQLLAEDEKVTLAPNSGVVAGLFPDSEDPKMPPPGPPDGNKTAPASTKKGKKASSSAKDVDNKNDVDEIAELFARHSKFIKQSGALRVSDLVAPLRKVGKRNTHVAYYLWVLIFPIVWQTLQREEQLQLAKPMIGLLSKEYHQRQAAVRPNVIQALLEGISLSQPQPKIPSELIKFLGGKFNAWHISIALLENHVVRYPQENRCFDALAELYRLLDEGDVLVGLWRQRCAADVTRAGLALAQHGHWQQAQDVFFQGMQNATSGQLSGVSKTEVCNWEAQWIQCAQQLNQWDLLADFAKSVNHGELQCHTSWRLNEWNTLRDILPPGHVSEVEETAEIMCVRAYSRLHAGRIRDAEQHWAAAVKRALDRWWSLPETGANCHVPMLHAFHVITEIQESRKVMHELANCTRPGHQNPQHSRTLVQDVLETWRLRTPNDWDPIPWHNQVLSWRGFMHDMIAGAQKSIQEVHPNVASHATGHSLDQLGMRDRAWAVNRFARIARKHNLPEVALSILSTQRPHVEVQEAFVKLSEQSRAYLDIEGEAVSGLNALDSTSLEYFAPHHQAKLFHLRGQFQERLGDVDGAHESYATSVSLCAQLPEVWNTWGEYCQMRADQANAEEEANGSANAGKLNADGTPIEGQAAFWTEQAATCVLQSIKHSPKDHGKRVVKIIHALGFSKHPVAVGRALQRHVDAIPLWVWIDWIPQLLLVLLRPEAPHAKAVLTRLACAHPQAVYYQLRTFLLERRDALARKTQTYNQLENTPVPKDEEEKKNRELSLKKAQSSLAEARAVFQAAKETVDKLRAKFGNLVAEIEVLLSELCTRFGCAPEERLLVVVHTLLHRCFKYPCATTSEVPAPFKKELAGVAKACFSPDTSSKHAEFVKEYKSQYEQDLDPESKSAKDTFPKTLEQLIQKLKKWKRKLSEDVERRVPNCLRLEDELPKLRDVQFREVEVPGSHKAEVAALAASAASGSAAKDHAKSRNRLVWIDSEVDVVRRHGNAHRVITFVAADGTEHRFAVQTSLTPQARSEERTLQLLEALNAVMERHPQSRRRNLRFYAPTVIPAWPQVRLVEDDKNQGTYGEVYEANCARYGRDPDIPMELFKAALNPAVLGQVSGPEAVLELRLKAFMDIASQHVTENIFSQYMYKTLPNGAHLWTFKRQLCQQLALSSFVSALLRIGGRTPRKISFAKNTGKVFMLDFYPNFDSNGLVEYAEPVPFRLTRNLHAFFTPFGVKGDFVATMAAAAQACATPGRNVRMHLDVYFRDSLTIWPWRQQQQAQQQNVDANDAAAKTSAAAAAFFSEPDASTVNEMAKANVEEAMKRLPIIAPIPTAKSLIAQTQGGGNDAQQLQSVQKGVIHLVESALNPKNLARMEVSWQSWL
jgi:transformation/transcription domain-associated protein